MIKGLARAGIGSVGSLEQFVAKASEYGFGAVDADGGELLKWAEAQGLDQAREFLKEKGVVIGAIGLPVEWRQSEQKFLEGLPKLAAHAQIASAFGCKACTTWVLPSVDENPALYMAVVTRRFRTVAQILGAYGIRLGLEFIGPHHLRTKFKYPFIWEVSDFLDWIGAIGEPNVGLLYDAYHWYTTESTVENILKLRPEHIVHVHINDTPESPANAQDSERVFPGEGAIDLAGFLRALNQIGYKGAVAQEVLRPSPLTDPSDVLLERSARGFRKVYTAAGLE